MVAYKISPGLKQAFPVNNKELEQVFALSLRNIYRAEKNLRKVFPVLKKAAAQPELKNAFERHTHDAVKHCEQLKKIFSLLNQKAKGKRSPAIRGIIREAMMPVNSTEKRSAARDAVLILTARKIEHHRIGAYTGLISLSKTLGMEECTDLLAANLEDVRVADDALSFIAEEIIQYNNPQDH